MRYVPEQMFLALARMSPSARSATPSLSTSGVFDTAIPFSAKPAVKIYNLS